MSSLKEVVKKVKELEETIETQKILIDALVGYIKTIKGGNRDDISNGDLKVMAEVKKELTSKSLLEIDKLNLRQEEDHPEPESIAKKDNDEILGDCSINNKVDPIQNGNLYEPFGRKCDNKQDQASNTLEKVALDQILMLLKGVTEKNLSFKHNYNFEEFVDYCSQLNYTVKTNIAKIKLGGGLKNYIDLNKTSIVYYLIKNINRISLQALFCSLLVVSRSSEYPFKISIVYNIMLNISNPYFSLYLVFAILNGEVLKNSILEKTLKMILNFQLSIDNETFSDSNIKNSLEIISKSLKINSNKENLIEHVFGIIENMDFDIKDLGNSCAEEILSVQLVCVFLDWKWSFNFLITEYLFPKFFETKDLNVLYIVGTVGSLGLLLVGKHESVLEIFEELKKIMLYGELDAGLISYYFVKRVDSKASYKWISEKRQSIEKELMIDLDKLTENPKVF